ncbi:MAG: hypothetical protein OXE44_00270 [Nitrospinae bacterium]|nr:hypothetical protein [Nitrospinota bacterium]
MIKKEGGRLQPPHLPDSATPSHVMALDCARKFPPLPLQIRIIVCVKHKIAITVLSLSTLI